jgi:microcystin degradation protein MlrC
MGDNVGGGSPADGTALAHELIRQDVGPGFVCLNDPDAVRAATSAGVGRPLSMRLGGRSDARYGPPLAGDFVVRGLFAGTFEETEPRHGGLRWFDQGPTAVVEGRGLTVMLTSRRTAPFSLRQLTAFGLDPARFHVIVAKGVHAPIGAYAAVCPTRLRVDTPGITAADLTRFDYVNRRRPLFPFESGCVWAPEGAP